MSRTHDTLASFSKDAAAALPRHRARATASGFRAVLVPDGPAVLRTRLSTLPRAHALGTALRQGARMFGSRLAPVRRLTILLLLKKGTDR